VLGVGCGQSLLKSCAKSSARVLDVVGEEQFRVADFEAVGFGTEPAIRGSNASAN